MRIPLSVEKLYSERYFAFVSFFIQIPDFRVAKPAKALIDTGSPYTVISPRDALAFQLPFQNWRKGETVQLAGFKFFRHPLGNVSLNFRDETGQLQMLKVNVHVLVSTKLDRISFSQVQHIPSIIGNDFLEEQKFALNFNPNTKTGFLERS